MADSDIIATEVLLRGAFYALEQAGRLVNAAMLLLEKRDYATACAVSLLSHEEFGRYQILVDLWRQSKAGTPVTREEVEGATKNHWSKQHEGRIGFSLRPQPGDDLDGLIRRKLIAPAGSEEWKGLNDQIKNISDSQWENLADARHAMRMRATYVDLNEDGTDWSRPCLLDKQACWKAVEDAINDYSQARHAAVVGASDPALAAAFSALEDLPTMPHVPPLPMAMFPQVKS